MTPNHSGQRVKKVNSARIVKVKKVKRPEKVPKKKKKKPIAEPELMATKLKIGDQFLCTYKGITFFVRKAPASLGSGWIIVEEQKNGSQVGIPGVFKDPDTAIAYFTKLKDVSFEEIEREQKRKGGRLLDKIKWKVEDRIVFSYLGAFYIGSISFVQKDWMTEKITKVTVDADAPSIGQITLEVSEVIIVGKGVDKKSEEPIPPNELDDWVVKEKEKEKKYSYTLGPRVDLPVDLDKAWNGFIKKIFSFIKVPVFNKMVKEYMLDYPLVIIEPDPLSGLQGTYLDTRNEVSLNWKHIMSPNKDAAETLVHEVIHYKLYPVKTKVRTYLVKNIVDILELNERNAKIKRWLNIYTAKKNPKYSSRKIKALLPFKFEDINTYYGLTNFWETAPSLLSAVALGDKLEKPLDELANLLYNKFEAQLIK